MKHIIEVENLRKSYGSVEAVRGISFYADEGRLLAFLGPNGAGKSTTINALCTFLRPDSGNVTINGFTLGSDDNGIRRSIGAVFQDSLLDPLLSVTANLTIRGGFYGLRGGALRTAVENAITSAGIEEIAARPYGKLSGGQRRRCDIARALINTPKILFLDEPTTGLDPQTRQSVWHTIRSLQSEKGVTVFLTTHYMEEAADADYVIVIDDGKIAAKGTPSELREKYASDRLTIVSADIPALSALLDGQEISYTHAAGRITVPLTHTLDALPILELCRPHINGFEVTSGTMDDTFIGITGKELRS